MPILRVHLDRVVEDSYDIEIGCSLIQRLVEDLQHGVIGSMSKYAIISDSNVEHLYGTRLLLDMRSHGFDVSLFAFEAGEKHKTRETKAMLEDSMIAKGYGRDSCVIAVGGGAVTDLAGFLAGTFGRGIPFVNYATTLLAAADASIGGKTAVNTPAATNLIGLFNQPKKVYIDVEAWKTLPVRELRSGLAETIKHACIADDNFFAFLEHNAGRVIPDQDGAAIDMQICEHIARRNCEIKYSVVRRDEREANLRQVLNLGHTIGRAVETLSEYRLLHGEAVAIGIAAQARMGRKFGFVTDDEMSRVIQLIRQVGLPTTIPESIPTRTLVEKLYTDKKVRRNQIRFVFQDGIGKVKQFGDAYSVAIKESVLYGTIEEIRSRTDDVY